MKQLNLDRSKLQSCINEYFGDTVSLIKKRSDVLMEVRRNIENKEMILQFYYLTDGRTTLGCNVGSNIDASKKLAEYIKNKATVSSLKNINLSFKDFDKNKFDELTSFLKSLQGVTWNDAKNSNGAIIIRYTGEQSDTITFTYHPTGTLQLQGRPVTLYSKIIAILSEYLDLQDIIDSQTQFVKVPIEQNAIEYELSAKIPTAIKNIDPITKKMLSSSIVLTKIDIDLPDYTAIAFPALRALEGHLKKLFFENTITITNQDGFGLYFNWNGSRYQLVSNLTARINCSNTITAIENGYNFYNKNRHTLFHAEAATIASRIIENREAAVGIIDSVLSIIEDAYQTRTN